MKFEDAFGKYVASRNMEDRECAHFDGHVYLHCGELRCFLCFSWHLKWMHANIYELDFDTGGPIVTGRLSVNAIVDTLLSGEEFDLDAIIKQLSNQQQEHLNWCLANVAVHRPQLTPKKETIVNLDALTDEQVAKLARELGWA